MSFQQLLLNHRKLETTLSVLQREEYLFVDELMDLYEDLVQRCQQRTADNNDNRLMNLLVRCRLRCAEAGVKWDRRKQAEEVVLRAEREIQACDWLRYTDFPRFLLRKIHFSLAFPDTLENLEGWYDLVLDRGENHDISTETALLRHLLSTLSLVGFIERTSDWTPRFEKASARWEELHPINSGDACHSWFSFTWPTTQGSIRGSNDFVCAGEYLHLLAMFESSYPTFDFPYAQMRYTTSLREVPLF